MDRERIKEILSSKIVIFVCSFLLGAIFMNFVGNGVNITKERYQYLLDMETRVLEKEGLYKEINSYDNANKYKNNKDEEVANINNNKIYDIKETYYHKNEDGNNTMSVKINSTSFTKERNEYANKKADRVLVLDFTYENLNLEENLFVSDSNFKVYDEEGNILESYTLPTEKLSKSISKGKKCTATGSYALNSKSNKLTVEFYSNIFDSSPSAVFQINAKDK